MSLSDMLVSEKDRTKKCNKTRRVFRTLSNIKDRTISANSSILGVWQGSDYTPENA